MCSKDGIYSNNTLYIQVVRVVLLLVVSERERVCVCLCVTPLQPHRLMQVLPGHAQAHPH